MRVAGAVLALSIAICPASAQISGPLLRPPQDGVEHHIKPVAAKKKRAPARSERSVYAAMPLSERVAIQFDLAWTGDYKHLIEGDFDERAIAAVKSFQKDHNFKQTGMLNPQERAALAAASKERQAQLGWTIVDDPATGAQVGLPAKQVPNASRTKSGSRWSSAQGQVQIETFRIREPGATLARVFEQQKKNPSNRRIETNLLEDDFFTLSGLQGLKKFYVRAEVRDGEVRGLTILYDQATEGIMTPLVVIMSSVFSPFPGSGIAAQLNPHAKRKVEYGSGIVVTTEGHVLTDRRLTDGCAVIEVSGHGSAVLAAEDKATGIALLRIYGAPELAPAALVHVGAKGRALTLVGIADPQAQEGGRDISIEEARLDGDALDPVPPLGFAGAAALGDQGRFFGMVALKEPVLASADADTPPPARIISVDAIRKFLDARYVTPATGRVGVDAIKPALVRVICVRR